MEWEQFTYFFNIGKARTRYAGSERVVDYTVCTKPLHCPV